MGHDAPPEGAGKTQRWTRWTVLGIALLVESIGGLFYMFSVYSSDLKQKSWPGGEGPDDTLTQAQLTMIGTASNLGGNLAIHVGYFYDWAGPKWTLWLAGVIGSSGWLLMWASLHFDKFRMPYAALNVVAFLQGQSQAISDIAVIPTVLKHFPDHRGIAIGITKAFVGLSGAIATQFYVGFFTPNITMFLLFLAIEIMAVAIVGIVFVHQDVKPAEAPEQKRAASKRFLIGYGILCLVAVQLLISTIISATSSHVWSHVRMPMALVTIVLTLVLYLFFGLSKDCEPHQATSINRIETSPLIENSDEEPKVHRHLMLEQYGLAEGVFMLQFWLQFFGFLVGAGSGLVIINNVAQMNQARHSPDVGDISQLNDVFVSLLSICNCLGRMGAGALGDFLIARFMIPRPAVFALANAVMAAAHVLLLASPQVETLYPATILTGLSYGAMNALNPTIASELYGTKKLGSIYTGISICAAAGSLGLAKGLAGAIYDKHAVPYKAASACFGRDCFGVTYIVCAGLCALGAVVMGLLAVRSKRRYVQMYGDVGKVN